MLKIAITGAKGLIGSRVIELLGKDFNFIELDLPYFDITVRDSVLNLIKDLDFDIFFHLAAYTNVDGAEKEKKLAHNINVEGTRNVFEAVVKKEKKLIFVSTDFVFDGKKGPYFEDSYTNPRGYYAKTKFEGEQIVKNKAMIVRFSYPYRAKHLLKPDFVRRIRQMLEEKKTLQLMADSLMTPTFIDDIAYAMKHLFLNFTQDVFHIVGAQAISPLEAGRLIAKTFNLDEKLIEPTTFKQYSKGKAQRSQYSDIRSKKNNFYKMKNFEEGLLEIKSQITNSKKQTNSNHQ